MVADFSTQSKDRPQMVKPGKYVKIHYSNSIACDNCTTPAPFVPCLSTCMALYVPLSYSNNGLNLTWITVVTGLSLKWYVFKSTPHTFLTENILRFFVLTVYIVRISAEFSQIFVFTFTKCSSNL